MPNRIRESDTSAVPAQGRRVLRMSTPVRVVLIVYGVCLLITFAALFWLIFDREASIVRELDKRTANRQAQNEATRDALCGVLTEDLAASANAQRLAAQYGCP